LAYLNTKDFPTDERIKDLVNAVILGTSVDHSRFSEYVKNGIVWLTPADTTGYYVEIPILLLYALCRVRSQINGIHQSYFARATILLDQLKDMKNWKDFELFCANYHAFKKSYMSCNGFVSLYDFYGCVKMPEEVKIIQIKVDTVKECKVFISKVRAFDSKNTYENELGQLRNGNIVCNGAGAKTDIVMADLVSELNSDSNTYIIRAVCAAHTEQSLKLTIDKETKDKKKTTRLNEIIGAKSKVISIHISNRYLDDDVNPETIKDAVVIGLSEWTKFAGPAIQRMLQSPIVFKLTCDDSVQLSNAGKIVCNVMMISLVVAV
jgi:hypothetical protein